MLVSARAKVLAFFLDHPEVTYHSRGIEHRITLRDEVGWMGHLLIRVRAYRGHDLIWDGTTVRFNNDTSVAEVVRAARNSARERE